MLLLMLFPGNQLSRLSLLIYDTGDSRVERWVDVWPDKAVNRWLAHVRTMCNFSSHFLRVMRQCWVYNARSVSQ